MNEFGKTLTLTEHMAGLIVDASQIMALTCQLYPYSVIGMMVELDVNEYINIHTTTQTE